MQELDFDKVQTIEDVKDILRALELRFFDEGQPEFVGVRRLWKPVSEPETKTKGEKTTVETKTVSLEDEQADFEKIAGFCSTFRDNYGMVRDGEMTTGQAWQRGSVLIGQVLDVAAKHSGNEYFDRIKKLCSLADPNDPNALQQVLVFAESQGSLPGGIQGDTDVGGDMTGEVLG